MPKLKKKAVKPTKSKLNTIRSANQFIMWLRDRGHVMSSLHPVQIAYETSCFFNIPFEDAIRISNEAKETLYETEEKK